MSVAFIIINTRPALAPAITLSRAGFVCEFSATRIDVAVQCTEDSILSPTATSILKSLGGTASERSQPITEH